MYISLCQGNIFVSSPLWIFISSLVGFTHSPIFNTLKNLQ